MLLNRASTDYGSLLSVDETGTINISITVKILVQEFTCATINYHILSFKAELSQPSMLMIAN